MSLHRHVALLACAPSNYTGINGYQQFVLYGRPGEVTKGLKETTTYVSLYRFV
jgi:hypothetical protein